MGMRWEELSASDFEASVEAAGGICLVPIGCLERHGDHLPLGTDTAIAREVACRAAAVEPFVIFPYYPFGFVSEVRHHPGTVALPLRLQLELLEATCDEIARNGFRKIVLGNGHGGNGHFLRAFAQAQLDRRCGYLVYVFDVWGLTEAQQKALTAKHGRPPLTQHGDLVETSCLLAIAPERVRMDRVVPGAGDALGRMRPIEQQGLFTALNWYGDYPQQLAGDPAGATAEYGHDILEANAQNLVSAIRAIRRDETGLRLLEEFYDASEVRAPQAKLRDLSCGSRCSTVR